jgi:hypothetical protein
MDRIEECEQKIKNEIHSRKLDPVLIEFIELEYRYTPTLRVQVVQLKNKYFPRKVFTEPSTGFNYKTLVDDIVAQAQVTRAQASSAKKEASRCYDILDKMREENPYLDVSWDPYDGFTIKNLTPERVQQVAELLLKSVDPS